MHVLLLYPRFPDTFWSYTHVVRMLGKRASFPPLGLLTVAALLPADWTKRLVDLNVTDLADADLADADLVMISGMAIQRDAARELVARCKAAGKTVVAGGPLFTGEYAHFEGVDHFVLNEAELSLPPFLADLAAGRPLRRVYRSREFADLAATPVPLWHLADLRRYASAGVQFSRGCPFDCDFCNVTALFGKRPRVKTGRQMIAELDALADAGWRGPVFFVDDNLIGNRRALRDDLLPALTRWQDARGPFPFFTQASVNLADDPDTTRALVRAGFDMVFVGIETPDPESLASCGKRQNQSRDLVADVRKLQHAGLEVQGGFIVGFDTDTPTTFQHQVDFIERSGIVTAMVGMLQAPPGTKLAQRLFGEGRLLGPSSGDNTDGSTNIVPAMGLETLRDGYRWLLQRLYAPRPYYRRVKSFLQHYRPPEVRAPIDLPRIRAFLRATVVLGLLNPGRRAYWSLLAWTLLHRPRLLPTSVRLAICGYHYRQICRSHGLFSPST